MLSWLSGRARYRTSVGRSQTSEAGEGFRAVEHADTLLATPSRQRAVRQLWESCPFSRQTWEAWWLAPLRALAARVQSVPAAETGPYAHDGGFLDQTLVVTVCAIRQARGRLLPPGAAPEEQAAQASAWATAIFWAALLHDLGSLAAMQGMLSDNSAWSPGLCVPEKPWRVRFVPVQDVARAQAAVLGSRLLPEAGLSWLQRWPNVAHALFTYLSGRQQDAALLHAVMCDVRQKCELNVKVDEVVKNALSEKNLNNSVLDNKNTNISADLILQNTPNWLGVDCASEHIPVPIMPDRSIYTPVMPTKSATLTEASAALATALTSPAPFGAEEEPDHERITSLPPDRLLSVLDSQMGISPVIPDISPPTGDAFWCWLTDSIRNRTLTVNEQDSLVHTLASFTFIQSPGCFYRFISVCGQDKKHKDVIQKGFEALSRHYSHQGKGLYFYHKYDTPDKTGRYTKLSGYMIASDLIFTDGNIPPDTCWLLPKR